MPEEVDRSGGGGGGSRWSEDGRKVGNKLRPCRSKFPWTSGSEMGMTYKGARARRVSLPGAGISCTPSKNPPFPPLGKSHVRPTRRMTLGRGLRLNTDRTPPPPETPKTVLSSLCKISSEPFLLQYPCSLYTRIPFCRLVTARVMYLPEDASGSLRFPLVAKDKEKGRVFRINVRSSPFSPSFLLRADRWQKIGNIPVGFFPLFSFSLFRGSVSSSGMGWKKGSELFCKETGHESGQEDNNQRNGQKETIIQDGPTYRRCFFHRGVSRHRLTGRFQVGGGRFDFFGESC